MPIFNFKCNQCNSRFQKLLKPQQAKVEHFCPHDNTILERIFNDPSVIAKEVIDNGLFAKKVEQFANSSELIEEQEFNNKQDKSKKTL